MIVMSIGETDPHPRPLTVEDLERMPVDGSRYELVDGRLEVSPAPLMLHQIICDRLSFALNSQAPNGFVMASGVGVTFNAERTHHRIPDLVVISQSAREDRYLTTPPLLAIEVVSMSSVFLDHHTKRSEYAKFGIESYWIISPNSENPGIAELRLDGHGQYRDASRAVGRDVFTTDAPFPFSLVPYWLAADEPEWRERLAAGDATEEA